MRPFCTFAGCDFSYHSDEVLLRVNITDVFPGMKKRHL